MVKKISAIFLALVLCLSVMLVPVSAADTTLGITIKADKEYVKAGDVVTFTMYVDADSETTFGNFVFFISYNNNVFNTPTKATLNRTFLNDFAGYYKNSSAVTTTNAHNNLKAQYTAEELEMYNAAFQLQGSVDTDKGTTADGFTISGADVPQMTFQLEVKDGVELGTKVNVALSEAGFKLTSRGGYIKQANGTSAPPSVALDAMDLTKAVATGKVGVEPCAPDAHVWDDGEVTKAENCGFAGEKLLTCTVCKSTKTVEIPATGNHTDGKVEENIIKPASCKEVGSKEVITYCAVCEKEANRETVEIPVSNDHVYATEVVEKRVDATCAKDGVKVMACLCGAEQEDVIPATNHKDTLVQVEKKDATCTEAGYEAYEYCTACDYTTYKEIPADGTSHKLEDVEAKAVTCKEDGWDAYKQCTLCDYNTKVIIPADHTALKQVEAKEPTCTEVGYEAYEYCADCDYTTYKEIPMLDHDYKEEVLRTANCTRTGRVKYTCACGENYEITIPAKEHKDADGKITSEVVPGKAPTCTLPGLTDGEKCTQCNAMLVPQQTIPATGHTKDPNKAPVVVEPTYESEGYTEYTCVCGEKIKEDIVPKLEANFTVAIKQPSITKIRCKDTIVLHSTIEGGDTDGLTVVWTADNENFVMTDLGDGKLEITSAENGFTVFTATVVDADGNALCSDTVEMQSKADIWGKIGGFFRALFGSTLYYNY